MRGMKKSGGMVISVALILVSSQCMVGMKSNLSDNSPGPGQNPRALINPERGWHIARVIPVDADELTACKNNNVTIILLEANLGAFLKGPLNNSKLNEIDLAFNMARSTGLSVIFRAAYDYEGKPSPEPTDINIILAHIGQLKPLFDKHEDILLNVQAGFLGSWGEWHSTYYGDGLWAPPRLDPQKIIADALLDAVPESVTVAFRRPEFIRNIAGRNEPVTEAEAFGSSKIARMAFHNDALMSDRTDMGTYADANFPRETELAWINNQSLYTPMIAETNKVSLYNNIDNAIGLLNRINILSLNRGYHPEVLTKWKNGKYKGINAFDYVGMMMGYRFIIDRADISETTLHGGSLCLDLRITNIGFGSLLKPKKFELALKKNDRIFRAGINDDARFWKKNEQVNRKYYFSLPSDLEGGDWEVYLGLSSTFDSLENNPAYSVCFANAEMWDDSLGLNKIGVVNLKNPGDGCAGRTFQQITSQKGD